MADEIIDHHFGDEEIAGERAADHIVAENAKAIELNYLLSSFIDGKVRKFLSPYTGYIFKIPEFIRNGNEKAYEPQILAIGPYHRGKSHLSAMEEHKMFCLAELLKRKGENSTNSYVSLMRKLEEKARACFLNSVHLNSNEFVEMMILDACFIVELVRQPSPYVIKIGNHHVPIGSWIMTSWRHDLLLVENQLPFFVLQEFYDETKASGEKELCNMIFEFFNPVVLNPISPLTQELVGLCSKSSDHLLGLLYMSWILQGEFERYSRKPKALDCDTNFIRKLFHFPSKMDVPTLPVVRRPLSPTSRNVTEDDNGRFCCGWFRSYNNWTSNNLSSTFRLFNCCAKRICGNPTKENDWRFIHCATELKEAGIQFKEIKGSNLFHVKFKNGVMEIPILTVYDGMESFFRNLTVYEHFYQPPIYTPVIDYVTLMDCLINTSKDVQLLRQCGIIVNGLGDDDVLANMFNRLCDNVTFFTDTYLYTFLPDTYTYKQIFKEVNQHCNKRWNRLIASLRHYYFNTPWALFSFLAALLLLLLTVLQTVFSVLAYIK